MDRRCIVVSSVSAYQRLPSCSLGSAHASARYLRVRYGMVWTDLRNLKRPMRVGDIVILPGERNVRRTRSISTPDDSSVVTGFSPGVGNFGAENVWRES